MAILGKSPHDAILDEYDASFLRTIDTPIGGKLLVAELKVPEFDKGKMSDMEIKRRLADILAEGILHNSLTEFTRMHDKMYWGDVYRARCYLAPSGDIKILRQAFDK